MCSAGKTDEMLEVVGHVLLRCFILGVGVLFIWWGALALMGDFAYSVHSSLIPMTRGQFNVIHYAGMLTTKAVVALLFFFPYLSIRLVLRKRTRQASKH